MTNARELPRLHAVTDDAVLSRIDFLDSARALLERGGPRLALHLRGHSTTGGRLYALGAALERLAASTGSALLVNDRLDVARAVGATGVQLGRRSIPIARARALIGTGWIGYSAHSADEASSAARGGIDFVVLGTIYSTASHPSAAPAGPGLIDEATAQLRVPVIAIGGVTPERVAEVVASGAYGVAAISGIWNARDIGARAAEYIAALAAAGRNDECEMMNTE